MGLPPKPNQIKDEKKPPKNYNMKKVLWNPVPRDFVKDSFWFDQTILKKQSKIDYDKLLDLFGENKDKKPNKDKPQASQSQGKDEKQIKVLDDKKLMNLGIALARVKITNENLKETLLSFNQSGKLDLDTLELIGTLLPTKEDIDALKGFKGDCSKLSHGEKFCIALMEVPKHREIIDYLKYKIRIEPEKDFIISKLAVLNKALCSIRDNSQLLNIMKIILQMGNFLNAGTRTGNCLGFNLNSLNLIDSVKSFRNSKYTLMDHLVVTIKQTEPNLVSFHKGITLEEALDVSGLM